MAYSSSSSPEISAAPTTDIQDRFSYKHATHDEVLEDLSSRFILNLPDEELASLERICFQVEQAHWFYEDFIREENPKFPSLPLKKFSAMLFHACPLLHQWSHDHEQAFNNFMQYKTRVPVCGAIMLNDTWEKCVLVKGWKSSSGWGFPKGKINENEPEHICAQREVLEETGYNLVGQINPQDVIQMSIKEQKISLYIVPDVPEDFEFKTKTRKEISRIEWFKLTDLPTWKRHKAAAGKFYLISPFIGALKTFINERKPRGLVGRKPPKPKNSHFSQGHRMDINLTPPSYPKYSPHAQESSSQSSSQDNGDPQTPSPQYSEPLAHHPPNGRVVPAVAGDSMVLDSQTLDPHFARLLSSLSMSAAAINETEESNKPVLSINATLSPPPASVTPVPATASSGNSQPIPDLVDHADWSSSVPTTLLARTAELPPCAPSHIHPGPLVENDSPISPRKHTTHPSQTLHVIPTQSNGINPHSEPLRSAIPSAPPSSISDSSASVAPSSPTTRRVMSRRASSTADISPYLSRPSEVPTSGKRLKQLALLESVADESARMTPLQGHKELPGLTTDRRHPIQGQPPASVPSSSAMPVNDMNDLRVIYSSGQRAAQGPTAQPVSPYSFNSRPQPLHHPLAHDDPFQVRPRSNQTYHLAPPVSHPAMGRQESMNQNQLLALMNGPPHAAGPPGVYPPHQHMQGYRLPFGPPPVSFQHPLPPRGDSLRPAQLQVSLPHLLPSSQSAPAPLSAPAVSPGSDPRPPFHVSQTSSSLLSILNSGRPPASGPAMNAIGHR